MNKTNLPYAAAPLRRRSLGTAIAVALAGVLAAPAQAFEFELGESWTGNLDTTVSYGIAQRTVGPADDLIGKGNFNPLIGTQSNAAQRAALGRFSVNSDDGNLNYGESGDVISNAFKITSELGISNSDDTLGLFTRATYFYDFENVDKAFLSQAALDKVGKRFRFLDAFVFHNFEIGEMTGNVRLGQQVVSWGESTFIQNGINVINPVDVAQLRVAGAELKEAFLPVNMIYGSLNFSENFSAEAFYLFEFEQTEPEPVGTYFSTNDFAALGGTYVMLGFGTSPQPVRNPELFYDVCAGRAVTDNPVLLALPAAQRAQAQAIACASAVQRLPDRTPDGDGQYGIALRYFSPELNDTEFGFFFMNYHSRLPLLSGVSVTNSNANSGRFFVEYPEDIRLYGLSFNTTIPGPGIALQGEVSYRDNMPLQFDDVELLFTALSPLNALLPAPVNRFVSQLGSVGPGQTVRGWERHEVAQWQVTATKTFSNVLGADLVAVVGEAGGTRVNDLPETSVLRYQGDGTDTGGGPDFLTGALRNPVTQTTGFPTRYSWGYRVAGRAEYNDVFAGVNLVPRVAFNHDVNGITPGPGGNFIEGRRSTTFGVEANYLNQWAADLAYTRFFGAGNLNLVRDRDFLAFTVRYSF